MADIFREVDEEMRQENLQRIWSKYKVLIIAAVVALLAGTAGYVGWQEYTARQRAAEAERFTAALTISGQENAEQAIRDFGAIAGDARYGYAALASLEQAGLLAEAGDLQGAIAVYDALAAKSDVAQPFRDLAIVLAGYRRLEAGDAAGATTSLSGLVGGNTPWRHLAREISALAAEKQGNRAEARSQLRHLVDDTEAPAGVRARAAEMLQALPE